MIDSFGLVANAARELRTAAFVDPRFYANYLIKSDMCKKHLQPARRSKRLQKIAKSRLNR